MDDDDTIGAQGIYYAELLAAKVVEGVTAFPGATDDERLAMLGLVAARLTEAANAPETDHAS